MEARHQTLDQAIVSRYTGQPARLPAELRRRIESAWNDRPVEVYAFAELGPTPRLSASWVALGPSDLAVAREAADSGEWELTSFPLGRLAPGRETPGLSATTLTFLAAPGEPPLAIVRFTHRQRRAFENLRFVVEERIAERGGSPPDADREYAEAVARPVRDAQAVVADQPRAVIWRLLGYLRPYRRQLVLGMAAATLITGVSLVPPWLAGYVLDRLGAPARAGTLPVGRAALLASRGRAALAAGGPG